MSLEMKATSRESRSSLATITGQRARRAVSSASRRTGRLAIASLAALGLDMLGQERNPLGLGEASNGGALGLDAEPG
ncbi:MAG: hypothetical protein AB8B85_21770 [Paracoccaceae bacterium]